MQRLLGSVGPASVGTMEVAAALESKNPVEALRIADHVAVNEMAIGERRARFCLYVSHAHVLRADDAAAAVQLLEAERHSREVLRHQVLARDRAGSPQPGTPVTHPWATRPSRAPRRACV
jgi:hypothetical protein